MRGRTGDGDVLAAEAGHCICEAGLESVVYSRASAQVIETHQQKRLSNLQALWQALAPSNCNL